MKTCTALNHALLRVTAVCAMAVSAASTCFENAVAQQPALEQALIVPRSPSDIDLERTFWVCDYVATTRGVSAAPVDLCAAAYEELKSTRFRGDFNQLLAWWNENKPTAHQNIAREERAGVSELANTP